MQQTLERDDPGLAADEAVASLRRGPRTVWAVVAVALVASRLAGPFLLHEPFAYVPWVIGVWLLGPWLVAGIVAWGARHLPVSRMFSPVQRVLVTVLAVGLFVVQHSPVQLDAYPFTFWAMYTAPVEAAEYTEFRMTAAGDPVGHLPVADLVPNTLGRAFMFGLADWSKRAEAGDREATDVVERTLRRLMERVDRPEVDAVEVRWCRVENPIPDIPAQCETVMTVAR